MKYVLKQVNSFNCLRMKWMKFVLGRKKEKEYDVSQTFNGTGYFVRANDVSLKYRQHKEGPYYSLR